MQLYTRLAIGACLLLASAVVLLMCVSLCKGGFETQTSYVDVGSHACDKVQIWSALVTYQTNSFVCTSLKSVLHSTSVLLQAEGHAAKAQSIQTCPALSTRNTQCLCFCRQRATQQ